MNLLQFLYFKFTHKKLIAQFFDTHPNVVAGLAPQSNSINALDVPSWHDINVNLEKSWYRPSQGSLVGYTVDKRGSYVIKRVQRDEYKALCIKEEVDDWSCGISDIHGFSASKSELSDFISTDQMIETNSKEMIPEITEEMLARNLAHREIRIINAAPTSDHFVKFSWSKHLYLSNSGGSHHLAAAKYIATRLNRQVKLNAKLVTYRLNPDAIQSLTNEFDIYAIGKSKGIYLDLYKLMEKLRVTWFYHDLPRACGDVRAILLPKNEYLSSVLSGAFRRAGCVDLGQHLMELSNKPQW